MIACLPAEVDGADPGRCAEFNVELAAFFQRPGVRPLFPACTLVFPSESSAAVVTPASMLGPSASIVVAKSRAEVAATPRLFQHHRHGPDPPKNARRNGTRKQM